MFEQNIFKWIFIFSCICTEICINISRNSCIGGAIGSIPVPSRGIRYPIGIEDFEKSFGKKFDMNSYSKIKFRYYVGELEDAMKADNRVDDGMPAPIHDMSYFDKSVPTEIGRKQRDVLGKDIFARAHKTIEILKKARYRYGPYNHSWKIT